MNGFEAIGSGNELKNLPVKKKKNLRTPISLVVVAVATFSEDQKNNYARHSNRSSYVPTISTFGRKMNVQ